MSAREAQGVKPSAAEVKAAETGGPMVFTATIATIAISTRSRAYSTMLAPLLPCFGRMSNSASSLIACVPLSEAKRLLVTTPWEHWVRRPFFGSLTGASSW